MLDNAAACEPYRTGERRALNRAERHVASAEWNAAAKRVPRIDPGDDSFVAAGIEDTLALLGPVLTLHVGHYLLAFCSERHFLVPRERRRVASLSYSQRPSDLHS